jgi:signal transduction histidine kinase
VLETTALLLRRSLGESVTIELNVSDAICPVLIDVSQLESALLNLAVNARDAMHNGGRLTIEASNVVVDGLPARKGEQLPRQLSRFAAAARIAENTANRPTATRGPPEFHRVSVVRTRAHA